MPRFRLWILPLALLAAFLLLPQPPSEAGKLAEDGRAGVVLEAQYNPVIIEDPGVPAPDAKGRAIKIVRDLSRQDFGNALLDKKGKYVRPEPTASAE